jgi:hypothetical protein
MVGVFDNTTLPLPVLDPVIEIVPDVVIGDPDTDKKEGTVTATEVTVPIPPLPGVV